MMTLLVPGIKVGSGPVSSSPQNVCVCSLSSLHCRGAGGPSGGKLGERITMYTVGPSALGLSRLFRQ